MSKQLFQQSCPAASGSRLQIHWACSAAILPFTIKSPPFHKPKQIQTHALVEMFSLTTFNPAEAGSNQEASHFPSAALAHLICLSSPSLLAWLRQLCSFLTITREFLLQFKPYYLLFSRWQVESPNTCTTRPWSQVKREKKSFYQEHLYLFSLLEYHPSCCQTSCFEPPKLPCFKISITGFRKSETKPVMLITTIPRKKKVSYDNNLLTQVAFLIIRSFYCILYISHFYVFSPEQLPRRAKLKPHSDKRCD